jgi:hypothetical protein
MSKIEIEIPNNKEIDWKASAKQKQIIFKDKQLTYKDVCSELFTKGHYYIGTNGDLFFTEMYGHYCPNNASTQHQLECILAKNKLANVARYLNGEWDDFINDNHYIIWMNPAGKNLHIEHSTLSSEHSTIIFKSVKLAQKAIEILGEETVKLALEPLY